MRIVFTGGGTGGHFYPIIAVAQAINAIVDREKLVDVKLYYFSDASYDKRLLFENSIVFKKTEAGKIRNYFSLWNLFSPFQTLLGFLRAFILMYSIYPDVVFSKGGYASLPSVYAAKLLKIPVIIHESDSIPGKANRRAGRFAYRIALAFSEARAYFADRNVVVTGNPIRKELRDVRKNDGYEIFHLDRNIPVVLFMGGSLGAQPINETLLDALPELLQNYQVIHQTGNSHVDEIKKRADFIFTDNSIRKRYIPIGFMNASDLKNAAGVARLVVMRSGSSLFEVAGWGIPSILIPYDLASNDHQRANAYSYARSGAAVVIEQANLAPHVLVSEIERIMEHEDIHGAMRTAALKFSKSNAAEVIAQEIISCALEHEK